MASRRLFVSVDLPAGLTDAFAEVQKPFTNRAGIRPVEPSQAHVTVKFLGDVEEPAVDDVIEAVEQGVDTAGVGSFQASIGGIGVFPSFDYISVIWIGVRDGATELTDLHEAIEAATVAVGVEPESHEFTPHVTLARMEHAEDKEHIQQLVSERDPTVGEMRVDDVRVKESTLGPDGPEYETIHRVSLAR